MPIFQVTEVEPNPQVTWDVISVEYYTNYPYPYFKFMLAPVGETTPTHQARVGIGIGNAWGIQPLVIPETEE